MRPLLAVLVVLLAAPARGDDLAARAARSYTLAPRGPAALAVGERGTIAVVIRCAAGVHLQRQAPLRAAASASAGLALARSHLGWDDVRAAADAGEAEGPVDLVATAPGPAEVRLRLDFFVCSDAWCVRQVREVTLAVAVTPAARPAAR